jgi:hypothetical protein
MTAGPGASALRCPVGCVLEMNDMVAPDQRTIAEQVRLALVRTAVAAYEDASLQGLCAEGAWEAAVAAMRQVDLLPILPVRTPPG